MLALLPLLAWGVVALWGLRKAWARPALAVLLLVLGFEQLVLPIPLTHIRAAPAYNTLGAEPGDFTLLEIPLGWRGSIVMQGETDDVGQFLQTADHKRRLGGITSRFPDFKLRYFERAPVLRTLIALEEGRTVDETQRAADRAELDNVLRFFGIRYLTMHRAQTAPETLAYVRETFSLQEIASDDERVLYRVTPPPPLTRWEADPASDFANLLFDETWGHAQEDNAGFGYRWAMDGDARLWLPLDDREHELTVRLRGARPTQKITLTLNRVPVATWDVTHHWGEYRAVLPRTAGGAGLYELVFSTVTTPPGQVTFQDRTIGGTGVVSPVDISVTGAGFDAGRYGEIFVAGQSIIPGTRGYHLVAINPQMGGVSAVGAFDTFADGDAARRMTEFIAALPQGTIVAGAAVDDASQKLTPEAFGALQSLGVAGDVRGQFRAGHAFIGIKGTAPGQAVEDLNARVPAHAAIGSDITKPLVAFALGPFVVESR
jgi:hypothetical protein